MPEIDVVYATTNATLAMPDGHPVPVRIGSHWPIDDPVVKQHPHAFSADPRYGMSWTGPTPHYMTLPPDAPISRAAVEEATAAPGERRGAVRRNG